MQEAIHDSFQTFKQQIPIGSMYGIFAYIYHTNQLNVGKYYQSHGSYEILCDLLENKVTIFILDFLEFRRRLNDIPKSGLFFLVWQQV